MAETIIDKDTWSRAAQFAFFRTFERPHFATTVRMDVSHLMTRKGQGVHLYRACLHAIGVGLHSVPELRTRFRGDSVVLHDRINLSMSVPTDNGGFNYAYVPFAPDFVEFDRSAAAIIAESRMRSDLGANDATVRDDVAYLSCLPWMDYTSLTNAMPGRDDCIPRVSWGKIVQAAQKDSCEMAMTLEVHHAVVDGAQVGAYFEAAQAQLNRV